MPWSIDQLNWDRWRATWHTSSAVFRLRENIVVKWSMELIHIHPALTMLASQSLQVLRSCLHINYQLYSLSVAITRPAWLLPSNAVIPSCGCQESFEGTPLWGVNVKYLLLNINYTTSSCEPRMAGNYHQQPTLQLGHQLETHEI